MTIPPAARIADIDRPGHRPGRSASTCCRQYRGRRRPAQRLRGIPPKHSRTVRCRASPRCRVSSRPACSSAGVGLTLCLRQRRWRERRRHARQRGPRAENARRCSTRQTAISPVSRYTFFALRRLRPDAAPRSSTARSCFNQRNSSPRPRSTSSSSSLDQPRVARSRSNPGFAFPIPVILEDLPATQTVNYCRVTAGVKGDLPNWRQLHQLDLRPLRPVQLQRCSDSTCHPEVRPRRGDGRRGRGRQCCDVNSATSGCGQSMAQPSRASPACRSIYFRADRRRLHAAGVRLPVPERECGTRSTTRVRWKAPPPAICSSCRPARSARRSASTSAASRSTTRRARFHQPERLQLHRPTGITKGSERRRGNLRRGEDSDRQGRSVHLRARRRPLGPLLELLELTARTHLQGDGRLEAQRLVRSSRGTYGTAFRAPALYELFLANQTGFLNQLGVDPCINYGTSGVSPTIQKNCASLGIPGRTTTATAPARTRLTGGGGGHLKPETSIARHGRLRADAALLGPDRSIWRSTTTTSTSRTRSPSSARQHRLRACDSHELPEQPVLHAVHAQLDRRRRESSSPFNIETVQRRLRQHLQATQPGHRRRRSTTARRCRGTSSMTTRSELDWTLYNKTCPADGTVINKFLGRSASRSSSATSTGSSTRVRGRSTDCST